MRPIELKDFPARELRLSDLPIKMPDSPNGDPETDELRTKAKKIAAKKLKGARRRIVELVCSTGSPVKLAALAIDQDICWERPFDGPWSSAQRDINRVMKPAGIRFCRHDDAVTLEPASPEVPAKRATPQPGRRRSRRAAKTQ
jgi:hypothetical protein